LTLDFDVGTELDFVLIGISCPLRDYRFCHFVSKHTGIEFVRGKEDYTDHKGLPKEKDRDEMDFHVVFAKNRRKPPARQLFSVYRHCGENPDLEYYLIGNRSGEGVPLLPELPTQKVPPPTASMFSKMLQSFVVPMSGIPRFGGRRDILPIVATSLPSGVRGMSQC